MNSKCTKEDVDRGGSVQRANANEKYSVMFRVRRL